jgi:outer membrane protein assembly factor BamB
MIRQIISYAALAMAVFTCGRVWGASPSYLIPETTAERHGLTRPWFTQAQLDSSRARVADIVLDRGTLFVQSDTAWLHAIDAETGQTLWAKQIGQPSTYTLTPGMNSQIVVVVNGTRLYAVNRFTGNILYEAPLDGVPGAGPAVSEQWAYVPLITGMLMAYRMKMTSEMDPNRSYASVEQRIEAEANYKKNVQMSQERPHPLICQSLGRAMIQPMVTRQNQNDEIVVWPTDRGYTNVARINRHSSDRLGLLYRVETSAGFSTRPAYLPPQDSFSNSSGTLFVTARDGFVLAVRELTGSLIWRYSVGEPMSQSAVAIDDRVYVTAQLGGLFCLDASNGAQLWWTPRIMQFISAGKERIYATDQLQQIVTLDAKTGKQLDALPAVNLPIKLVNSDTDRIYLATVSGLVQCLHDLNEVKPILHNQGRVQAAVAKSGSTEGDARAKKPVAKEAPEVIEPIEELPKAVAKPAAKAASDDPFAGKGLLGKGIPAKSEGVAKDATKGEETKKAATKTPEPAKSAPKGGDTATPEDPFG